MAKYLDTTSSSGQLHSVLLGVKDVFAVKHIPWRCGSPRFEAGTGAPSFNKLWSLLGTPCSSVALRQTAIGLPVGVQVVGAMVNDTGVLMVADWPMMRFTEHMSQQPSAKPRTGHPRPVDPSE